MMPSRHRADPLRGLIVASICLLSLSAPLLFARSFDDEPSLREQIRFAAEMAQKGNWREAILRWERVLAEDPHNPRLHNNLAVAYETLGEYDKAEEEYQRALKYDPHRKEIRENYALSQNFYNLYRKNGETPAPDAADGEPPGPDEAAADPDSSSEQGPEDEGTSEQKDDGGEDPRDG
jgi:tetratricopeptide (TPR) repeat protein